MATSSRLLSLLSLLQARRDWAGPALADRLNVSARTVRRDVDRLREMGYRIVTAKGPDGGYRLEAGSELPPLLFDDEQAVALAVGLRIAASSGVDIGDGAVRALTTVRQVMPSRLAHRIDALALTSLAPSGPSVDPAVLLAISAAVRAGEVLRFDYDLAPSGSTDRVRPPRRVEPHSLVTVAGRWYLVAWNLDLAQWRIYRVDRMSLRTPTGPRFAPRPLPGGDLRTFVSARFKGSDGSTGVDAWPCNGEVVLALPASSVAPFVGDGTVTDLDGRTCKLVQGSWSWPSLAAAFCRFDADLEVLGPPELARAFADLADRCRRAAIGATWAVNRVVP